MITPEAALAVINERFGRRAGYRALHAKGSLYHATFTATPEAGRLTRAAHMQGQAVDATVRFSNGSGDPGSPDHLPDVRGMATTFHLADGSRTDISAQSLPSFPVSTPDAFMELVRASAPRPEALWRLPLFLVRHPRAVPTLKINAEALRPPASYAGIPYYAVHAFKWLDGHDGMHYVRYRWEPEDPEPRLARLEARSKGPNYLQEDMRERLTRGPVQFKLMLQLAAAGDPVDDPSAAWPEDRETAIAGTLKITDVLTAGDADDALVFDPTRITDGIEPSADPVLLFRPRAYALSAQRRTAG